MQIGKPLRTFVVEPLESPVPVTAPNPEADQTEQVAPTHEVEPEPVLDPVKQ